MNSLILVGGISTILFLFAVPLLAGRALVRRGGGAGYLPADVRERPMSETQEWLLTARQPTRELPGRSILAPAPELPAAPTMELEPLPAPKPVLDALPTWVGESTIEAELVELDPEYKAERAFYADPLGSWVLPPETEAPHFLPEADYTFRNMVECGWLTGIGADIDLEWEAWNLYEREGTTA